MIQLTFSKRSVTLTDATDLVTANSHGVSVNNVIKFLSITTTTGISTNTAYYVANNVNLTANTFQISGTPGGSIINLVNNGTANVEVLFPVSPLQSAKITPYKQVLTQIKFSPISVSNVIISFNQILTQIKFSPIIILQSITSNKIKITNILSEFVNFSPMSLIKNITSLKPPISINSIITSLEKFSSISLINVVSYNRPIWKELELIDIKFSPITTMVNIIYNIPIWEDIKLINIKFSPVVTGSINTALDTLVGATSKIIKFSFVKTIAVITRKIPDAKSTWSQITTQVKTLIEFWS